MVINNNAYGRIPDNKKKTTPIVPSDFEHWTESHSGDKDFVNLINTKVAPRKRRSLLSNVSFAYSSDESSNSEDEEDEEDFYQLVVNTAVKGKADICIKKVHSNSYFLFI